MAETVNQILKDAATIFSDRDNYAYWYGGKMKRATTELLAQLSKQYPKIYTSKYIENCKQDIQDNKTVVDCSGFVCFCYGMPNIGTSQMVTSLPQYKGETPLDGMILWKKGHCGIYANKMVYQAQNQRNDIVYSKYRPTAWEKILYLPSIDYGVAYSISKPIKQTKELQVATKKMSPSKITWTVNATRLNVRTGYSTDCSIIGQLGKGDKVQWYGYTNNTYDWILVSCRLYGTKTTGWISKKYVS